MDRYNKLRGALSNLYALLRHHDEPQQKYPLAVIEAIDAGDVVAVEALLNSLEFWGGSGSILDLFLQEIPWTPELREDKAANEQLRTILHRIRQEMLSLNIMQKRFRSRVQ